LSGVLESESSEHRSLVRMMADYFRANGYSDVRAVLDGSTAPDIIAGRRPDVTARRSDGLFVILEAETCDGMAQEATSGQWLALSRYASQNGYLFQVCVPVQCGAESGYNAALRLAGQLGITLSSQNIWHPTG